MTGWAKVDGSWFLFDPVTGAMKTGWQLWAGGWYYLGGTARSDCWPKRSAGETNVAIGPD